MHSITWAYLSSTRCSRSWVQHLQGDIAEEWSQFTFSLKHSAIKPKDDEDKLIWAKNKASGKYTAKLGYESQIKEEVGENK